MSQFKKLALAIISVVGLSTFAYAAITPVTKTDFGVQALRSGAAPMATPTPNVTGDACEEGDGLCEYWVTNGEIGCTLSENATGVECEEYFCCHNNTDRIAYYMCPSSFAYADDTRYTVNVPNLSQLSYCQGYMVGEGVNTKRYNVDIASCSVHDITNEEYISTIGDMNADCDLFSSFGTAVCQVGLGDKKYCTIPSSQIDNYPECPSGKYKKHSDFSGIEPSPCKVKCGDNRWCGAWTDDPSGYPLCDDIKTEKEDEGYWVSINDGTEFNNITTVCRTSDNQVKYIWYGCQGYIEKETCEADHNGTTASGCTKYKWNGSAEISDGNVFICNCGSYKTKDDCEAEGTHYSGGKICSLDKDGDGNTLTKYEYCRSLTERCDYYNGKAVWIEESADSNPTSEFVINKDSCYIGTEADASVAKTNVNIYCKDYTKAISSEAKNYCDTKNGSGNSTPIACHYNISENAILPQTETSEPRVFIGCSCDSKFKTKAEWCKYFVDEFAIRETEFISICKDVSLVSGEECYSNKKDTLETPIVGTDPFDESSKNYYLSKEITRYDTISCKPSYKTREEWCAENPDKIHTGYKCEDYVGKGTACKTEAMHEAYENSSSDINPDKIKYAGYVLGCPADAKEDRNDCLLNGESTPHYKECQTEAGALGTTKYICTCPPDYVANCDNSYEISGGTYCGYDRDDKGTNIIKYKSCNIMCGHEYAAVYSDNAYDCSNIDSYPSPIRKDEENQPQQCTNNGTRELSYICACPTNFMTLNDWCIANAETEGVDVGECISDYVGRGTKCKRDVWVDYTNDNTIGGQLTKYAYYVRLCPTDKPLYYSEDDCRFVGGEYAYKCQDGNSVERVVCKCPSSYYNTSGESDYVDPLTGEAQSCLTTDIGEITGIGAESSGEYCDFDGYDDIKYEQCVVKCSDLLEHKDAQGHNDVALPNAYTYLNADSKTPTQTMCAQQMGNGAQLGYGGQAYCSLNHTLMYPCYCPASFRECSKENNEIAADNALVCKVNGTTYYSECKPVACQEETPTRAVVSIDTDVETNYGVGAEKKACISKSGDRMWEVTCDASAYPDPCDYPYEEPSTGEWCKYGDGSTLMKSGRKHYKAGACKIRKTLGACGTEIAGNSDPDLVISVASTESECRAKFGNAISTQLCEYGKDQGYKRAYNCYYDASDFIWTTRNCGVRHNLSGEYLIINGVKHWNQCRCASAYQHHKFNCGGLLSGSPCQQQIDAALLTEDPSLNEAEQDNFIDVNDTLPFYPYCECSADYTEICDEDGTGRYKGVGTACNGKYQSCECVPDPLPDNWTDNYYGCAGGKKPTGVWKDNGCGKKYWQCTVNECTWEYTEMCEAPLIPVGESCQDNQGNVGGYKACTCPSDYKTCPVGQVGEGEPCNLKGVSYYKSCKSQDACNSLANETCTGPLQIGVNPCTRDTVTYYESCVCANGYDKACGEGKVGVGNYCELDGVKYYKECAKPEDNQCTEGHVTACDTNQESYSPCVGTDENGKPVVKYLCKCPSNWKSCSGGSGEQCTQKNSDGQETTYWSECNSGAATCSDYQELTYKVCTSAQTGDGGSCTSNVISTGANGEEISTPVVKYAQCKDSGNCLTNGFRYSCSGYDSSYLGESCVDDNGNKLYKECPCPTSYVSCSNGNATKGSKCTPLKADGSFGSTVYSSCECDRSKYKYTCALDPDNEPYNLGIKAPSNGNYCEVEEEQYVYETNPDTGEKEIKRDDEGNRVTEKFKVKYYTNCDCKEEYQYTCSDTDNGEKLPDGYEKDYCQVNGTKFYKGCDCSSDFKATAEECAAQPGQTVNVSNGKCSIRGIVIETSTEDGTSTYKDAKTLYKGCTCKPSYSLPCRAEHDQTGIDFCKLDSSSPTLYPRCACPAGSGKSCNATGLNQGITAAPGSVCVEEISDGAGGVITNEITTGCVCKSDYDTPGTYCEFEQYDMSGKYYCDLGSGEIKYSQCYCDGKVYDTENTVSNPDATSYCTGKNVNVDISTDKQFCKEWTSDTAYVYRANKSLCLPDALGSGWVVLSGGQFTSIEEAISSIGEEYIASTVEAQCGHKYNAEIAMNTDKKAYYKCIKSLTGKWYTQDDCKEVDPNPSKMLEAGGTEHVLSNSWAGSKKIYRECKCPGNNYTATTDSCKSVVCRKRNNKDNGSTCAAKHSDVDCSTINANAINRKSSVNECILPSGTVMYYAKNCSCNTNVFKASKGACLQKNYDSVDYKCVDGSNHYYIELDKGSTSSDCSSGCDGDNCSYGSGEGCMNW